MIHPQELLVEATDTGDWFEHRCDGVRPLLDGILVVHDETGPWSTERPHDDGSGAVGTWEVTDRWTQEMLGECRKEGRKLYGHLITGANP